MKRHTLSVTFGILLLSGVSANAATLVVNCGSATSTEGYNNLTSYDNTVGLSYKDGTSSSITVRASLGSSANATGAGINSNFSNESDNANGQMILSAWQAATEDSSLLAYTDPIINRGLGYTINSGSGNSGAVFTLAGLEANREYTLSVFTGKGSSGFNGSIGNFFITGVSDANFIQQISGNASDGGIVGSVTGGISGDSATYSGLQFRSNRMNYTEITFVAAGDEVTFSFYGSGGSYGVQAFALQEGDLIPEPATATLGLLGLMGLALRRKK